MDRLSTARPDSPYFRDASGDVVNVRIVANQQELREPYRFPIRGVL
jgi:hypothetical protein